MTADPAGDASTIPAVTAVVPTRVGRPQLLERALASVWHQRGVDPRVVLVVDGPEEAPLPDPIASDPRVEVVRLPTQHGQRGALDAGVERVATPWVAFLDDDDEWHSADKLARQVAAASAQSGQAIVSSRVVLEINGLSRRVAPARAWRPGEDLGEFAFCADRRLRIGLIQQSTLLAPTELARAHPFDDRRDVHPDIGLVLQCVASGAHFVQLEDALSTWRIDDDRVQMSTSRPWRDTLDWCRDHTALLSPAAFAGALLTAGARGVGARRSMPAIWRHARKEGKPRPADLVASLYLAYVPRRLRRRFGHRPRGRGEPGPGSPTRA